MKTDKLWGCDGSELVVRVWKNFRVHGLSNKYALGKRKGSRKEKGQDFWRYKSRKTPNFHIILPSYLPTMNKMVMKHATKVYKIKLATLYLT